MPDLRIEIAQPCVGEAEWAATRECFESGWLTQGPKVAEFERAFALRHQVEFAVATTSCTTALHLGLHALGIGPGDEVVVPAFTWIASANVVRYCGATPVFCDVQPDSYNLDPSELGGVVTANTRAVIAVHLFGLCADVPAIRQVIPDEVAVVEDAACAVGSTLGGTTAGALGDMAAFSFHPRKIITTGEGGMLTTNNADLAEIASVARNHGASISEEARHLGPQPYLLPDFDVLGFNYRMTDLQGAVGSMQLSRLDELIDHRRAIAARYDEALGDIPWLTTPHVPPGSTHSYQSYVCVVEESKAPADRNELMARLQAEGVSTRPGTHAPVSSGLYSASVDPEQFPTAIRLEHQSMAIPLHNRLSDTDVERVIEELHAL